MNEDGDLVDVTSAAGVLALQKKSRKIKLEFFPMWCGATDFSLDNTWTWSDGSPVNSSLLRFGRVIGDFLNAFDTPVNVQLSI